MDQARSTLPSFVPPLGAPVVSEAISTDRRPGPPSNAWVIAISIGAHVCGAIALGLLPAAADAIALRPSVVAVSLSVSRPEAPAPAPLPVPEIEAPAPPEPTVAPRRVERSAEPEPAVETPAPPVEAPAPAPVTAAPPSLDDVFGDPPPAPDALAAAGGSGGFTVPRGEGGSPGGRAGGTGATIGGGGSGDGAGATVDDAGARRRARLAYKRELERLLRARSSYPRAALRDRLEGRVELALRIGADGAVLGVRVAESSGYALLDDAAVGSARADRLPAPPAAAGLSDRDELTVGLVYVVR